MCVWLPALAIGLCAAAVVLQGAPAQIPWLLLGAPLAEELVFRAGIQDQLEIWFCPRWRHGTALAVAATSALFAASHGVMSLQPGAALTFLPSLLLGAVHAATHRVRHAVALHAGFNALWLLFGAASLPLVR